MRFKNFIIRYPVISYFIIAYTLSWLGALLFVSPKLFSGKHLSQTDGILMFPIMIIGPAISCIFLTYITDGKAGLKNLRSRMVKWKVPFKWYLVALLIPPCIIILLLSFLKSFVSPAFTPNFFLLGILFGIPAGFFEEIGWSGFAFPKMHLKQNLVRSGIIIGLLWGLWHLPVIDYLGAAYPHGKLLLPFILSFIAILIGIRLLIVWVYSNTNSILVAQLMHIISTGSLVVLGPPKVSPFQEVLWYALYAALLWITVLIIFLLKNRKVAKQTAPANQL